MNEAVPFIPTAEMLEPTGVSTAWFGDSAALVEAIVQSSEDAIITKDLNGIIKSFNPAAERLFGYSAAEMIGQPMLKLIPEAQHGEEYEILRNLRAGRRIAHFVTTRRAKSGRILTLSLVISPLKNDRGEIIGATKVARDITEQRALDESQFRLAAIVESTDDAVVSKDLDGVIQSWNPAAARLFGYTPEEIVGKSILTLIPPELHEEERAILARLRNGERIEHFETVRVKKNGERFEASLTISPVRDRSGKIIGVSKVLRDISERIRMERSLVQAEKLAASSKVAATLAHEINNPLEAVLNLLYLARSNAADPSQMTEYLAAAESEVERLAHIARQTLGFYREQAAATAISLADLIRDTLWIYETKMRALGIELRTDFRTARRIVLKRGEMTQVISNLVMNSIYAMPEGGVLEISACDTGNAAGQTGVRVMVRDTGTGIPESHMPRVFEPFFTTREATGTGIGLWLARQFLQGHEGSIELQSSVDAETHGTTVTLWIPEDNPYARAAAAVVEEAAVVAG